MKRNQASDMTEVTEVNADSRRSCSPRPSVSYSKTAQVLREIFNCSVQRLRENATGMCRALSRKVSVLQVY